MPLIINGEKIDDILIEQEIDQMRPQYQATFTDQTPEQQEKQLREWARENVIERVLMQQAAKNDPIPISQKKIDEAFENVLKEHGSEEKFYKNIGLTKEDEPGLKKNIEIQLRVERLVENFCKDLPKPSVQQAKKYYDENIENYISPEQVRAAHIVKNVDAKTSSEQAKQAILKIQKELKSGKQFEALADQYSDCPGNGGDLGYFPRGHMVQAFEDVVFSMKKNEISDVFQTEFGFHIAKVYDKKPKSPVPFEQVKENIVKQLDDQNRNERVELFLDELRAKAEITEFFLDQPDATADKIKIRDSRKSEKSQPKTVKPLSSILVKPAGPDCNMACGYCFYLEKAGLFSESKVHRMSLEILEEMIRQVCRDGSKNISFGWQGGEPTLMGLPFYQKAVEFQQRYGRGQSVGNGLQTNGILIDKDWAKFLKEYNFLVGLSLDGPEHVHNHYRLMRGGNGTWDKVVDHGKLMLDAEVAVNALTVVNDYSVQFPEEIYEFHKGLGLTFQQYIPCVETDPHDPKIAAPFSVSPEKFGEFLCTLFDLWMNDFKDNVPTTSIRHFDSVFYSYVGMPPPECTLLPECGIYVVVEHDGGVYSCDFFVEPEWKLGNIMDGNLIDFLNSERQLKFGRMKSTLPDPCKTCKWLKYCWGGCTKDRIRDQQDNNLSHFCKSYQMFYEHADQRLQQLADRWKREQVQNSKQENVIQSIQNGEIKVGRNDPCPCGSGKKFKKCCGSG